MSKNLSTLIADLQKENDQLKYLQKVFEKTCKREFGFSIKEIHALLDKQLAYEKRKEEKTIQHVSLPPINDL